MISVKILFVLGILISLLAAGATVYLIYLMVKGRDRRFLEMHEGEISNRWKVTINAATAFIVVLVIASGGRLWDRLPFVAHKQTTVIISFDRPPVRATLDGREIKETVSEDDKKNLVVSRVGYGEHRLQAEVFPDRKRIDIDQCIVVNQRDDVIVVNFPLGRGQKRFTISSKGGAIMLR